MAADPNSLNYWLRNGSIFFPYGLGKVAGTADSNYWLRLGTIAYPADIQPGVTAANLTGHVTCTTAVAGVVTTTSPLAGLVTCTSTVAGTVRTTSPLTGHVTCT